MDADQDDLRVLDGFEDGAEEDEADQDEGDDGDEEEGDEEEGDEEEGDEEEKPEAEERDSETVPFQKMLKTRTILLSGEINKAQAQRVISRLVLFEDASEEPVKIFIDSPGGDADAGFAIFDMVRFVKPPAYMIGMGLVASAAAIILLAVPKERRIALPNSHYLIHQPLSGMRGVATEIEIHAREIQRMRVRISRLIAAETGQPIEKVEKDTDRDFWMTADEAIDYGLVSRVVTRRDELGV